MNTDTRTSIKAYGSKTVHARAMKYQFGLRGICGSGDVGVGSRRSSKFVATDEPVTCKKCLKKLAERS